jgi:hypothetical protein
MLVLDWQNVFSLLPTHPFDTVGTPDLLLLLLSILRQPGNHVLHACRVFAVADFLVGGAVSRCV